MRRPCSATAGPGTTGPAAGPARPRPSGGGPAGARATATTRAARRRGRTRTHRSRTRGARGRGHGRSPRGSALLPAAGNPRSSRSRLQVRAHQGRGERVPSGTDDEGLGGVPAGHPDLGRGVRGQLQVQRESGTVPPPGDRHTPARRLVRGSSPGDPGHRLGPDPHPLEAGECRVGSDAA